jgi:hypothetical protein
MEQLLSNFTNIQGKLQIIKTPFLRNGGLTHKVTTYKTLQVKKIIEKKLEKKTNFTCPIDLQQKEKTGNDLRGREKMV